MKDKFGRNIDYMRISVTDRCSLSCIYCTKGDRQWTGESLSDDEILAVCRQAASIGIENIRITGGEPLMRPGCAKLAGKIKDIKGIKQVGLTTNGVYLTEYTDELKKAGIDGINVSLDTLSPEKYIRITGKDLLGKVREGTEAVLDAGIPLRINTVLMKGINDDEIINLASFAAEKPADVRFIEMMPVGCGKNFALCTGRDVLSVLEESFGKGERVNEKRGNGPAVYYRFKGFKGLIGFISPISENFCSTCSRIRMTSEGRLKGCLCFEDGPGADAGHDNEADIRKKLIKTVSEKPLMHCFGDREKITEKSSMVSIGG